MWYQQEKPSVEEIERRIAEAVAAAVAGPNDLAQEASVITSTTSVVASQGRSKSGNRTQVLESNAYCKCAVTKDKLTHLL